MGFLDKITGTIIVGVFVFALLMFGFFAQTENNVTETILDDEHFAGVNDTFSSTLDDVREESQTQRNITESQDPQIDTGEGFGILTIPKNVAKFTSLMFSSFNLVTNLLENVFGIPAIVFNVLGGLLIIIIVILGWRVIKAGGT
jgi:hypothetical protein